MDAEKAICFIQKWLQDVEGVGVNWFFLQAITDEKDREALDYINKVLFKNQKVEQI